MQLLSYAFYGITADGFDPHKTFVRSSFIPPIALACIRALIALYCFTTIIVCYSWLARHLSKTKLQDVNISSYTLITDSHGIGQSFSFFTYLTFWSLSFYFSMTGVHTFMYALRRETWLHNWPRPLQLLHNFYYTTATSFPFLVSVVFWATMYAGPWSALGRFEQWINTSVHGLNSLFAIIEIIFPATEPPPWSHLSILLLVLSLYLGLAYLTRWTGGFYVYEWMDPAHGNASIIVHILCYSVGIISIFALVRGAILLRIYVTNKLIHSQRNVNRANMIKLDDTPSEVVVPSKEMPRVIISAV